MLYQVAVTNPSAFIDVTQGNNNYLTSGNMYIAEGGSANDTCSYGGSPATSPCYEATVGYDMASGLGLPVGSVLTGAVRALAVSPFSVSSTSLPGGVIGSPYSATLQGSGGSRSVFVVDRPGVASDRVVARLDGDHHRHAHRSGDGQLRCVCRGFVSRRPPYRLGGPLHCREPRCRRVLRV